MGDSCSVGFADLFRLAKGRVWTRDEEMRFRVMDQAARNTLVKELAAQAGCVETEDRIGTDGLVYTAFWIADSR